MSEVTLLTYGGGDAGEYIVFYQDGKGEQEYMKTATLPNQEQVGSIWNKGDQIDFISFGRNEWCTVTRKKAQGEAPTKNTQEMIVVNDEDFAQLEKHLKTQWEANRVVTQLTFGQGKWVVLSKHSDSPPVQKLVTNGPGFPEQAIQSNWDNGFFIKSSAFGLGKYALVFEKGDVPQSLYMDKDFPEVEIEDLWTDCYSVSGLLYGDGKWVLISNEQSRNNHQGWVSDTQFPADDLDELMNAGGLQPKLPPAMQVQGISKNNWLWKKAPANWKPWKRRWFVLSAKKRTCYYYAEQTDEKPKGYFFINGCTVGPCEDTSIEKKHPNTFQVAHPIRRTFYVQAGDMRTRDEWISEIQALLDEDFVRKKTEIEKFIEDILKPGTTKLEWGVFIKRMKEILDVIDEKDEDRLHYVMFKLAQDDKHDPNIIDTNQITAYVSAFGFVEDSFDKLTRVAEAFHGIQTQETAEKILEKAGKQPGQYCIWFDRGMTKVCISSVTAKRQVDHKTVTWDYSADQFFVEEDVFSHDLPVVFRSIESCLTTPEERKEEWSAPVKSSFQEMLGGFKQARDAFRERDAREQAMRAEEERRRQAEAEAAAAAQASEKKKKPKAAAAAAAAAEEDPDKSKKKKKKTSKGRKQADDVADGDGDGGDGADKKKKSKRSKKKKEDGDA